MGDVRVSQYGHVYLNRYIGIKEICLKAPTLAYNVGGSEESGDGATRTISKEGVTNAELFDMRRQLITKLENPPNMTRLIEQYP